MGTRLEGANSSMWRGQNSIQNNHTCLQCSFLTLYQEGDFRYHLCNISPQRLHWSLRRAFRVLQASHRLYMVRANTCVKTALTPRMIRTTQASRTYWGSILSLPNCGQHSPDLRKMDLPSSCFEKSKRPLFSTSS